MIKPAVWSLVLAAVAIGFAGTAVAAAKHQDESINPPNAKLLSLPPAARAAELAKAVGHWCVGTDAFPMGVSATGRGAGNAYWSLHCADGSAWAVQIDPLGEFSAMDCTVFNAGGGGNKCFEKIRTPAARTEERK